MKPEIKAFALKAGIPIIGFCRPGLSDAERRRFYEWLDSGRGAGLRALSENPARRLMETPLLEGQKSVVMCGFPYPAKGEASFISDYALLDDYHTVVRKKLDALSAQIRNRWPESDCRPFVDSSPVPEKLLAARAGLGFIGRNTLLIHPESGTRLFLGGLLTTLEIEPDPPRAGDCGGCEACIRACPVAALSGQGLDARLCLSYHTVENKTGIPDAVRPFIKEKVFGCSVCETVCPLNRTAAVSSDAWIRHEALAEADLETLAGMCRESFRKHFGRTPVYRTGRKTLLRNIMLAMSNAGLKEYICQEQRP